VIARAQSVARTAAGGPLRFNAPLFRSVIDHLDTDRRCVVLDLGMAHTETVALFGRYRCRLDIADLGDGLDGLNAETEPARLRELAESLLPAPHGEAADAVLCWDLFNYLERPALTALMSRVAMRARPGTLVHALIVYSATHMPAWPGQFVPQDDLSLLDVALDRDAREAPRYAPTDVIGCMPRYTMERAMLLSNGMQEMLFRT
jgi:hypothetical protein